MYIEDLINTFEEITENIFPELNKEPIKEQLKIHILNKKYDTQDQTLIEAFLEQDKSSFVDSFTDSLNDKLDNNYPENYLSTKEGQKTALEIYVKSVEHMIDYYYNSLISKHFSST